MELKVKNLASSDSRGYDLQKEVIVKVTKQGTHEVRHPLPLSVDRHGPSQKASKVHRGLLPVASRRPRRETRCSLSKVEARDRWLCFFVFLLCLQFLGSGDIVS